VDGRTAARDNAASVTDKIVSHLEQTLTSPEPLVALRALTALRADLDAIEREQAQRALAAGGSFAGVARALGISRQAAHRRYRGLLAPPEPPRPKITADARRVLALARDEAIRAGSETIDATHIARALTGARSPAPLAAGAGRPRLDRRLLDSLARVEGTIHVLALRRAACEDPAARRILERAE
jgi:hypothetical protein